MLEQSAAIYRELEDWLNLGAVLVVLGDYAEARLQAADGLTLLIHEGGHWFWLRSLACAAVAAAEGDIAASVKIRGWFIAESHKTGEILEPTEQGADDFIMKAANAHARPENIENWMVIGAGWSTKAVADFILRRFAGPSDQGNSASGQNLL